MGASCCNPTSNSKSLKRGYRRALWTVLAINAAMFTFEIGAGLAAGSASLQADALDFLGDTANYAISLLVVGMALRYRARAALVKGATMCAFGVWVIAVTVFHSLAGTLPQAFTMGAVGLTALLANAVAFELLGHTEPAMRTCVRPGFARATTFSEILRCSSLRSVSLGRELDGRIPLWPQSWQCSPYRERPLSYGKRSRNCATPTVKPARVLSFCALHDRQ